MSEEAVERIVAVDFGKDEREASRRLAHLLGLAEEQREAIAADPVKFYNAAAAEIARLQLRLRELRDAGRARVPSYHDLGAEPSRPLFDTVTVTRDDYDALRRLRKLLEDWAS